MKGLIVRDFLTGVTALVGLIGLILMLILFGELSWIGERYYSFSLVVSNAGGLSETSPVTLNGVKVGQVDGATILTGAKSGAELQIRVRHHVRIPRNAEVSIDRSLVGDASLEFTIPAGTSAEAMGTAIAAGETIDAGEPSTMISKLTGIIDKPLDRFSRTADNIDKLALTYTQVGERINELLEPRTQADVESGKEPNIRSILTRADTALTGINRWVSDDQLLNDARAAVDRAAKLMDEASQLAASWSKTASTVEQQATNVGDSVKELSTQALATLRRTENAAGELATVLETVNKGEGTVGQLVSNPDLYNSLRDAAQRLDRALTELQLMVEKYKAEGIPIKL